MSWWPPMSWAGGAAGGRGEPVGQLGAGAREAFLVGLGGRDLQQRDQLAGTGQPVLHQAVVAEFEEFLDADAGGAQDLHDRPGPEGVLRFEGQVAAPAGVVFGPDAAGPGPADEDRPSHDEGFPRLGALSRAEPGPGVFAVATEGGHQRGEHGQALPGPRVHPCLALARGLAQDSLLLADGARRHPGRPATGVFDCPAGQVQVEGPPQRQTLPPAHPRDDNLRALPGVGADLPGRGWQALLPLAPYLAAQVEAADAGIVGFEVGPEAIA